MWYKDDQPVKESRHFQIDYDEDGNCSLTISEVCGDDDAKYTCKAVNSLGEATCTAELLVETMAKEGEDEDEEEEEWNKAQRKKKSKKIYLKTLLIRFRKASYQKHLVWYVGLWGGVFSAWSVDTCLLYVWALIQVSRQCKLLAGLDLLWVSHQLSCPIYF